MFSKYLMEYGWQPYIFTSIRPENDPNWQPTMEIQGLPPEKRKHKVIYGIGELRQALEKRGWKKLRDFFCPDYAHPPGWVEIMLNETGHPFFRQKFDVIYSSSPDLGTLTVAKKLARMLGVPWVADFRDIHEQDRAATWRDRLFFLRMFCRRLVLLRTAGCVITVSNHHARVLQKSCRGAVQVIPNGYDREMYSREQQDVFPRFSITYVGRILSDWLQNPSALFRALDLLRERQLINVADMVVNFYGTEPGILEQLLAGHPCRELVEIKSRIPFQHVPGVLQKSCILLLLTNRGREGILTTKAYEYMGARRPILCVPGDGGELDRMLSATGAGVSCASADTTLDQLLRWHTEWAATGTVRWSGREEAVARYTRKYQAGRLAEVLNQTVAQFRNKSSG